jgi:hypothetical protein
MNRHASFNSGNSGRNLQNGSGNGDNNNNTNDDGMRDGMLGSSVGLYSDTPDGHGGQQVCTLTWLIRDHECMYVSDE